MCFITAGPIDLKNIALIFVSYSSCEFPGPLPRADPQERPHQPHQPHWMPHGVDPHNHMPVRHMAEGPAAAPGSTVPMVDGQGRYEAPTLQQLQIWHHMNAERTPPASLVQDSVQRPIALRPAENIHLARLLNCSVDCPRWKSQSHIHSLR